MTSCLVALPVVYSSTRMLHCCLQAPALKW